jgi:hypothetical protein
VPFEVAAVLLVAMIGAIVIGKRELSAERKRRREFILEKAEVEKEVKGHAC